MSNNKTRDALCETRQRLRIGIRWFRSCGKEERAARMEHVLGTLNHAVVQHTRIHGKVAARAEFNERITNRRGGSHAVPLQRTATSRRVRPH